MERRKLKDPKRYLLAFIIATLVFVLGFAITYSIAYVEYNRITSVQDPISYEIFQDKLQYTLFEKDVCSEDNYIKVSKDLAFQGGIIGDLEEKLGKSNEAVLFRKKFYSLVQLEHLETVKMINERCDRHINIVLFFYSNEKDDIEHSEKLGDLLGVLYERNPDDLVIYSFDLNLDSEIISSLKEKYDVGKEAKVILNDEYVFSTLDNISQIESLLN